MNTAVRPLLAVPPFVSTSQLERPALSGVVHKLAQHQSVQFETTRDIGGTRVNPGWLDYREVVREAQDAELVQLLFHESPVVRAYMTWAIAERCPPNLVYLEYLLADRTEVSVFQGGCHNPDTTASVRNYALNALHGSDHEVAVALRFALINSDDRELGDRMLDSFLRADDALLSEALAVAGPPRRDKLRGRVLHETFTHRSKIRCEIARAVLAEAPEARAVLVLASGEDDEAEAVLRSLATTPGPCAQAAKVALVLRPSTPDVERGQIACEPGIPEALANALQAVSYRAAEVPHMAHTLESVLRVDPARFYRLITQLWSYAGDEAAALATFRRLATWLPVGAATGVEYLGHRSVRQLLFEKLHGYGGPEDAPAFLASLESIIPQEFQAAMRPLVNGRLISEEHLASFRGRSPEIDTLISAGVAGLREQRRI